MKNKLDSIHNYLHQRGVKFMTISLFVCRFVCLLASTADWIFMKENENMGLGPT